MTASVPFHGVVRVRGPSAGAGGQDELEGALSIGEAEVVVEPRGQAPLRVDFSEVDALAPGDYALALQLADGASVEFAMLGRRFAEFCQTLSCALRDYQAHHLLLDESVGGEVFEGEVTSGGGAPRAAEVRVYATSIAVLPTAAVPFAVPFGEVTGLEFDEARYAVALAMDDREGPIRVGKLGRQTRPFADLVERRIGELRQRTSAALAALLPQLPSLTLRRLAQAMPDGVPARRADIDAVAPDAWPGLLAAVNPELRATVEALAARCPAEEIAVGIKETSARLDRTGAGFGGQLPAATDGGDGESDGGGGEVAPAAPGESGAALEAPAMAGRTLWFAFPLLGKGDAGSAIAVEAVTRKGRATYLFRMAEPAAFATAGTEPRARGSARAQIRTLSRALVALGFRREAIRLPAAQLREPRYSAYRLALRRSPALQQARAAFLGRAIHGPAWQAQLEAALRTGIPLAADG